MNHTIPEKTNRILNIIILGLLLILIRVWYLSVLQHEEHLREAKKPQRRSVIEKIERATIRDRFNIPLALNKIQYNAAVCYADIRQIPSIQWQRDSEGKRVKKFARNDYIKRLSAELASELSIDSQKVEDTIHGKASLFPHTPFVLKENLSEEEYFRLKALEKDWVGLRTEASSKRFYPLGKVGSDVIGYMGAISSMEYYRIAEEMKMLQTYLSLRESGEIPVLPKGFLNPLEVRERLRALQEKAYTINDLVGKTGVEGAFDSELRGYVGKKTFEVDTKGNFLRELPGSRKSIAGQRIILSISSELQEFAEQLLAQNETTREIRNPDGSPSLSAPWIKGGAIVAMEPNTGEILALASYPRLEPNDFIPSKEEGKKNNNISKWLESEAYIGEIWDGKRPLERERYDDSTHQFYDELLDLTFEKYLEAILPANSEIVHSLAKIGNLKNLNLFQRDLKELLRLSGQESYSALLSVLYSESPHHPSGFSISAEMRDAVLKSLQASSIEVADARRSVDYLLGLIKYNDDKLLLIDICRLLLREESLPTSILDHIGGLSLSSYRQINQLAVNAQSHLYPLVREWFHQMDFKMWREANFKDYLKQKRKEERQNKQYTKPYTEYLEAIEKQMFKEFWEINRYNFALSLLVDSFELPTHLLSFSSHIQNQRSPQHNQLQQVLTALPVESQITLLKSLRSFEELDRPLVGKYRRIRNTKGIQLEKHLAAAFYPLCGYSYGRSYTFRQVTPAGSVYKLVPAYQALVERFQALKDFSDLNPLTIIDDLQWHSKKGSTAQVLGYTLDGKPIHRLYKGAIMPRSSHAHIGKVDLVGAIEQSSNIYFSILANDHLQDPENLIDATRKFSYGEKTGIELPGEVAGALPDDLSYNRAGLFSVAIGQHSLVVTPLQTAVMLSAIANKGDILKPKIVQAIAGREPLREYRDPFSQNHYPFQDNLSLVGIHFPLFTSMQAEVQNPFVWYNSPEVKHKVFLPDPIRLMLIDGMHKVIVSPKGTARPNIIRALYTNPEWKKNYNTLKQHLIGKTGTAEILYKQTIDAESTAVIHNHIWFGGTFFSPDAGEWEKPEITIVVFLRLSAAGGKEAAPLAAEMIKKWKEICAKHGKTAHLFPE